MQKPDSRLRFQLQYRRQGHSSVPAGNPLLAHVLREWACLPESSGALFRATFTRVLINLDKLRCSCSPAGAISLHDTMHLYNVKCTFTNLVSAFIARLRC